MKAQVERRGAPSLFSSRAAGGGDSPRIKSLVDLMHVGFHLISLVKNGAVPKGGQGFDTKVRQFLEEFEQEARQMHAHEEDIKAAKYAYCAALDELLAERAYPALEPWKHMPLQLRIFNDALAGELFFDKLEALRSKGGARLQALQVFHLCLLLGFRGSLRHDNSGKLAHLTARLGEEIAHLKGKSKGFAPQAERPDQVAHKLRSGMPLWALSAVFGLAAMCVYISLKSSLEHETKQSLAGYTNLVKLAPRPANLTITLP